MVTEVLDFIFTFTDAYPTDSGHHQVVGIRVFPADPRYEKIVSGVNSGVGLGFFGEDEDPENELFATKQDIIDNYYPFHVQNILDTLNNQYEDIDFVEGNQVLVVEAVQEAIDASLPETLDDLAEGTTSKSFTSTLKTKLDGISTAATANDTDANLKARANHTGTQAASTITGLSAVATTGDFNDLSNKPVVTKVYSGTTLKSAPVFYTNSATVSSGVVVFHITDTGLSGGNALFPNGPITTSLNAFVSDSAASYQMAGAWSNSNKTLTITTNKLGTANILTGILGQVAGNGSVVNVQVWGN